MDGTVLGQGTFEVGASVIPVYLQVPQGCDWVKVRNLTQSAATGSTAPLFGIDFYWQYGMTAGQAFVQYYTNSANTLNGDVLASGGITLYDPTGLTPGSNSPVGAPVAQSGISNATRPVVSASTTPSVGQVVRVYVTAGNTQSSVSGVDFVVGTVSAGTSFTLTTTSNPLATAPGTAGGAGHYVVVNTLPLFYPPRRYISNITQASEAVVTTTTEHNMTVGQTVRFNIPAVSGMTQINPSAANNYEPAIIVAINNAYSFTVNINSTSFTAFTSPTTAQMPATWPQVDPFGIDTATALTANSNVFPQQSGQNIYNANSGILADSTVNTGFLGLLLGTGGNGISADASITGPAGSAEGDYMFWVAGKSTYGGQ